MELSAWLRQQIAVNGGVLHVRQVDGTEIEVNLDDIAVAEELDRRLAGITFWPRLVVDSHGAVESLSATRADSDAATESGQQSNVAASQMVVEICLERRRPGRPLSADFGRVAEEIIAGINSGEWTLEWLETEATQDWVKAQYGCSHGLFESVLEIITGRKQLQVILNYR